jgi:hypothetical protein
MPAIDRHHYLDPGQTHRFANTSVGSIFHGPVNGCTGTTSMLTGPLGAVPAVVA